MQINRINNNVNTPSFGSAATMANGILKGKASKLAKVIEYNGVDMSFPVLIFTMLAGVLVPRVIQAKDAYDKEEIIRRDAITIGTIGVGANILSKVFSKYNEAKSGFALATKSDNYAQKGILGKVIEYIRPIKGVQTLTSDQIIAKYSNLDQYKNGVEGFCQFIDKQGGNLKKLFGFTTETKGAMENIMGGAQRFANADNKSIISAIQSTKDKAPELIETLTKHFADKNNSFVKKAKSMNSKFGFLSTFLLVPALLGFALPKINEKITKKKFLERNATQQNQPNITPQNPLFMALSQTNNNAAKSVFNTFKNNK